MHLQQKAEVHRNICLVFLNDIPSLRSALIYALFGLDRALIKHCIYHRGGRRLRKATLISRLQSGTGINC